jgi:hypothetical protein
VGGLGHSLSLERPSQIDLCSFFSRNDGLFGFWQNYHFGQFSTKWLEISVQTIAKQAVTASIMHEST